jgi:hypothetical protein
VKALVAGAFAEHSAAHTLVDGLAEEAILRTSHHYLVDPSKAKGEAKALLYAAFGGFWRGTSRSRSADYALQAAALPRCRAKIRQKPRKAVPRPRHFISDLLCLSFITAGHSGQLSKNL